MAGDLIARIRSRRALVWALALAVVAVVLSQAIALGGEVRDPTDRGAHLTPGAVVLDSALLVFREGLEMILVLAAVTASFRGAQRALRRPVTLGAAAGVGATVATWFVVVAAIGALGASESALEAGTGLLAVVVLLVVMNWFFHRVYWTGWIAHHHRRRRRLVANAAEAGSRRTVIGLTLLGATSVYREGFETVLFLQNLRLKYGSPVVLEGAAIGFALIAAVGFVTFAAHSRLPYRRLLVATGVMLGAVLVVIVGQTVQSFQVAGWLPVTRLAIAVPGWLSTWFSIFPTLEGVAAQVLAAAVVLGSYLVAENLTVKRPRARSAAASSQA